MKFQTLFLLLTTLTFATGCNDRFQEGYSAGYKDGLATGEKLGLEKFEQEYAAKLLTSQSYAPTTYTTTEVCGGGGINVGGKHYSGGKTGCVRVLSDGTVQRY